MTKPPLKSKVKDYPSVSCACGCGKTFIKKRSTQKFFGNHRNKYYDQRFPRHKIGVRSTITLDGWVYPLGKPWRAIDVKTDGDSL